MKSTHNNTDTKRIKSLDGLRAFCALGVVWIHVYTMCGRPSLNVFGVDLYKPFIILGNGVDFFFVISGFCLYLVLHNKKPSVKMALKFIWNRFWRIAPAYYAAVLLYAYFIRDTTDQQSLVYSVFSHLLFVSNYTNAMTISGPFWSIVTEWSFYLLLPLILIKIPRVGFLFKMSFLISFSFVFTILMYEGFFSVDVWETNIVSRFPEFAVGILACYFFVNGKRLPSFLRGMKGLFLFICITYLGRIMGYTSFFEKFGPLQSEVHSLSNIIMTTGFAMIMFHLITEKSKLQTILSRRPSLFLGKISYSMYLWHSMLILLLHPIISKYIDNQSGLLISFFVIALSSVPVSYFSYYMLERIYLKIKSNY